MTYEQLPLIMLRALVLTLVIEGCTAWLLGIRNVRDQSVVALANILTNPLVVSIGAAAALFLGRQALVPVTLISEIAVVVVEGSIYRSRIAGVTRPYVLSLFCNLVSFTIGEILNNYVF